MKVKKVRSEALHLHSSVDIPNNPYSIDSLQGLSEWIAGAVFAIGCAVVLGWVFNIGFLKSVFPGFAPMQPDTAIGFILSGVALYLLRDRKGKTSNQTRARIEKILKLPVNPPRLVRGIAISIVLLGAVALIQYFFGLNFGIDRLFHSGSHPAAFVYVPTDVGSAINLCLMGFALFFLSKKSYYMAQCLALTSFLGAFLGLLGYLLNIKLFSGIGFQSQMAFHSIITFMLLSAGTLFVFPDRGVMAVTTSDLIGGILIRRLVLAVVGIPPVLCWLIITGKRMSLYSDESAITLLCVLSIVVLAIVVWWNARTVGVIDYQALHDLLTGLPNRVLFNEQLTMALANARYNKTSLAVMFLDLDRFKKVNDTLGHALGDRLLQAVAQRLTRCLHTSNAIARWGGDEFTVLLPEIANASDSARVARDILKALQPTFVLQEHQIHITSSIGIAVYPRDGEDIESLIKNADVALHKAKESGRNSYQFYTPPVDNQDSDWLTLESKLHKAWERGEFVVYYQPKVNISTGKVTGMEALVRWHSPELGLVPPGRFVPLAEDNGLILQIGESVLRTACIQNKAWIDAGYSPIRISVNLSARQFQQPDLIETIAKVLEETQIKPYLLELEITETLAMQNVDFTRKVLGQLSRMGVQIALDDFGTGYSSLNYLKNFPFHTLKIDRSFVQDLTIDPSDIAIASAVVSLGHGLNMLVVAEGVETREQVDRLRSMECDEIQGYFFRRPLTSEDATSLMRKYQSNGSKHLN